MLLLLFRTGTTQHAIDARNVVEVIPFVQHVGVSGVTASLLGLVNYRGTPVPLCDLSQLISGIPSPLRLSTRIVLIHYPLPDLRGGNIIGMTVEDCLETLTCAEGKQEQMLLEHSLATLNGAEERQGGIQLFIPERVITPELAHTFFQYQDLDS